MGNLNLIILISIMVPICFLFLILKGSTRALFLFLLFGMFICFFSGEVSGLLVNHLNYDYRYVVVNITPVIEEILKLFPLLLFAFMYDPDRQTLLECSIAVGLGFAIIENVFYLLTSGDVSLMFAIIRGCCSGPLHCFCTLVSGYSLNYIKLNKKFFVTGTISLLSMTIIIHAIYNLMIQSKYLIFGAFIPVGLFILYYFIIIKRQKRRKV